MSQENDYNFINEPEDSFEENLPAFYYEWEEALKHNRNPHFIEADEINQILEIYAEDYNIGRFKSSVKYALMFHPDNEDLLLDIMMYLNDLKQWNELYDFSEKYKEQVQEDIWPKSHKLIALLHLGMEEDAFTYFQKLKKTYEGDTENLSIIYQAFGEALNDIDLHEAVLKVVHEAYSLIGISLEMLWIELRAYTALKEKENAYIVAEKIEKLIPLDEENWADLGNIYGELEDYEKAIDAFEFAKSLGLKTFDVYMNLIDYYEKNNNLQKAYDSAKEYLNSNPNSLEIYPLAIALSIDLQLWSETFAMIDTALAIRPTEEVYLCKSEAFLRMGEHKKAIQALQEGLEIIQDDAFFLKGHLEELKNQFPNYTDEGLI